MRKSKLGFAGFAVQVTAEDLGIEGLLFWGSFYLAFVVWATVGFGAEEFQG